MSSNRLHSSLARRAVSNNENPVKNIKNSLITNRKQSALKVLTNTVHSTKKPDSKSLKHLKVMPMKSFQAETNCKSSARDSDFNQYEDFSHVGCVIQDNDFLPSSMTCNIDMLSDFFRTKNDEGDWFLDDYRHNNMINEIKNTFEKFGEPDVENCLPSLPVMDFDFSESLTF